MRYNHFKKNIYKLSFQYFIFILSSAFTVTTHYGCSNKNKILSQETIEITFVTKQDANLYNDVIDKIIIDELPAFIKVNALEKIVVSTSDSEKVYYKTIFNNKEGWLESIYLANIKKDNDKKDILSSKKLNQKLTTIPNQVSNKKIKLQKVEKNGRYYVQIASFQNEKNAKNLFKELNLNSLQLSLEKIKSTSGNYFFKLVTKKYNNKTEALNVINIIKKKNSSLKPIIKLSKQINFLPTAPKISEKKKTKTEYYTIQISSFENKKAAEKLANKMTKLGYPSKVTEAWIKGKTWFRVQHGEYKMISVAKQISIKLKDKYKFSPWISNIYK